MAKLLRQLDRIDARERRQLGRPGDRRRRVMAGLVGVGLAVSIGLTFANRQFGITVSLDGLHKRTPLGAPPEVRPGEGSFAFMRRQPTNPGRPVAYDPCRAIEYQVNAEIAPGGGEDLVHEAVEVVEAATGLDFRYAGRTQRTFDSAGVRGQPVLVAWATPDQVEDLHGDVAGVGGSTAVTDSYSGQERYVTGRVALDTAALSGDLVTPDGKDAVLAIIVHELGHVVGLGHVQDPGELMYDDNIGRTELGPGDREGLALLGSGRCF